MMCNPSHHSTLLAPIRNSSQSPSVNHHQPTPTPLHSFLPDSITQQAASGTTRLASDPATNLSINPYHHRPPQFSQG
ncbi:hypothetical protein CBS63078_8029 [Aspergillus niger]|nr:hypothetical protein CBS115989_7946 [Aspergillus niger]KAI2831172.1 hypothetical protein CBS133816_2697 [Aspergillus niger]KAI2840986.1 hypothetical protein CBS11350_6693 [Aspergillus niger]KAI2847048.1 hypothetical protein CBS11232_7218 [Aspergillus niger]KAI2854885.1 hypothetical protein CBS12448_7478 [Aspergillus niger]